MNVQTELDRCVFEYQKAGQEYVEAKVRADQLKEQSKNLLARLSTRLSTEFPKASEAKLERLARTSADYEAHLVELVAAQLKAQSKKVRYDGLGKLWDGKRSELALEREKIAKGIYHTGS